MIWDTEYIEEPIHKDCISLSMLIYSLFHEVSLHSSGLLIDDFSTVSYTESCRAVLLIFSFSGRAVGTNSQCLLVLMSSEY